MATTSTRRVSNGLDWEHYIETDEEAPDAVEVDVAGVGNLTINATISAEATIAVAAKTGTRTAEQWKDVLSAPITQTSDGDMHTIAGKYRRLRITVTGNTGTVAIDLAGSYRWR